MKGFYEKIEEMFKEHSRYIQGVLGDEKSPTFFYTIGNHVKGLPELLLIAPLKPELAAMALNQLSDKMLDANKPLSGLVDLEWSFPFKVREAGTNVRDEFTIQAGQVLGAEDYKVLQVMICDKDGVYPDEAGCGLPVPMP